MEVSGVNMNESISVINTLNQATKADKTQATSETELQKASATGINDSVAISGGKQPGSSIEYITSGDEITPNATALESMSNGEADAIGGQKLVDERIIDEMKSIAMSSYEAQLVEMDLPQNQVPNANGDAFGTAQTSGIYGGAGEVNIDSNNVNININIDDQEPKPKTTMDRTGLGLE